MQQAIEALAAFGVSTLPEVVLDEDPDNADAAHAVQILLESLSPDLPKFLHQAASAMRTLLDGVANNKVDAGEFWQELCASDIDARMLAAFLNQLILSNAPGPVSMEGAGQHVREGGASTKDALMASYVFLALLRVPGARTHIFSAFTLRNVMKLFERQASNSAAVARLEKAGSKRKRDSSGSNSERAAKSRRARRSSKDDDESEHEDATDTGAGPANARVDEPEEDTSAGALEQLEGFLEVFSLQTFPESLAHCMEVALRVFLLSASPRMQQLGRRCARAALASIHGPLDQSADLALKCILPWLLDPSGASGTAVALAAHGLVEQVLADADQDKDKTALRKSISILCQQLCVRVADRAPARAHASAVLGTFSELLCERGMEELCTFLCRYAQNAKVHYRVFGVEVVADSLARHAEAVSSREDGREPKGAIISDSARESLVRLLRERASDKMPAVRAKALSSLAACMPVLPTAASFWATFASGEQGDAEEGANDAETSPSARTMNFADVVRRRSRDQKSAVRKAAVQLLEAKARMSGLESEDVEALEERCCDASVLVKKAALDALSSLATTTPAASAAWVRSCLPLVKEQEQSVQEKSVSGVLELIIEPIASSCAARPVPKTSWDLMALISDNEKVLLHTAIRVLARRRPSGLPQGLPIMMVAVKRLIQLLKDGTAHQRAWWLVEEVCAHQSAGLDVPFVVATYEKARNEEDAACALRTLTRAATHISKADAAKLFSQIVQRINALSCEPTLVHELVKAAAALEAHLDEGKGGVVRHTWCEQALATCDRILKESVEARLGSVEAGASPVSPVQLRLAAIQALVRSVFLAGEISMVSGVSVPTRLINSVQALFSPAGENVSGEHELRLQGHVIAALGKMCLCNAGLAKKCVSLFLRELETTRSAVLRNNVLVVLTDLCIRYTSLVDPHITKLAACLRDENEIVRQHALFLITNLLVALVDDSAIIREQARQCLLKVLQPKSGNHICHAHLVESIFVLNDYTQHQTYNKFPCTTEERARFSLAGDAARRREIYALVLHECSDEQRFQITSKLCEDVLGAVADGVMPLATSTDVLADALHILASKEIKLSAFQRNSAAAGDDAVDAAMEDAGSNNVNAVAKRNMLDKIVRGNVMQNVVPTLAALKTVLEAAHSPLLGAMMACLAQIMKEYKNEINEILMSNKQLAKELQYDLRQHEKAQAAAEKASSPHIGKGTPRQSPPIRIQPNDSCKSKTPLSVPRLSGGFKANVSAKGLPPRSVGAGVKPTTMCFESEGAENRHKEADKVGDKGEEDQGEWVQINKGRSRRGKGRMARA